MDKFKRFLLVFLHFIRRHVSWQAVATVAICCVFIIFFFRSRIQGELEDFWFDLRMQVKPQTRPVEAIKVISLDSLEHQLPEGEESGFEKLDVGEWTRVLRQLSKIDFQKMILLTFENTLDFNDKDFGELLRTVQKDSRIYWGTLRFHKDFFNEIEIPKSLKLIENRLIGVDLFRDRSVSVVRKFPLSGYQNSQLAPMLALSMDPTLGANPSVVENRLLFNFIDPKLFEVLDAKEIAADPAKFQNSLKDRVLVAGSLKYREWASTTSEPTMVNTSIRQNINNVFEEGESLTFVIANLIENVLNHAYLKHAHWVFRVPQWIGLLVFGIMFFRWSVTTSLLVYCAFWCAVIYLHGLIYAWFSYFIPVSSEFMFLTMALLVGIWTRSDKNARSLFAGYLSLQGRRSEFALESTFFKEFSDELTTLNRKASNQCQRLEKLDTDPGNVEIYEMLKDVQADFAEYLQGVKQVSEVDEESKRSVVYAPVALFDLLNRVQKRFSIFAQKNALEVQLHVAKDSTYFSDANILDAILHNLISNAMKYSPKGGVVEVCYFEGSAVALARARMGIDLKAQERSTLVNSAWKDRVKGKKDESRKPVLFSVSDRGPGIPEDKTSLVFEKFYRIKDDGVYRVKGTGLGLYLCRFFASKIGGRVDYYPRPGGGSIFVLEIDR